jgi:hypothetical protein
MRLIVGIIMGMRATAHTSGETPVKVPPKLKYALCVL